MGRIAAICIAEVRGTPKQSRAEARLIAGHGLEGDAHAGKWHRQVSVLPLEKIDAFRRRGAAVNFGDFGENLVVSGIECESLHIGDQLLIGDAVLELTQFGKECHNRCRIYDAMGDCIMPRHGMFAIVVRGGPIRVGDAVEVALKEERGDAV